MKMRVIIIPMLCLQFLYLNAQRFNNVFDDTKNLKKIYQKDGKFDKNNKKNWLPIIKKYVPDQNILSDEEILEYFDDNPFGLSTKELLPIEIKDESKGLEEVLVVGSGKPTNQSSIIGVNGQISTSVIADGITQLVIQRAKEELTATFFEQFKDQLKKNQELSIAFPKTTAFIGEIESYLYASYLTILRQAFIEDIANFPFQIGSILRTPKMRLYLKNNPKSNNVWLAVPVLHFISELKSGKPLINAIRNLQPDKELKEINTTFYFFLKLIPILSESIRDTKVQNDWIKFNDLQNLLSDSISKKIFFGLLYQSVLEDKNTHQIIEKIFTEDNISNIVDLLKKISTGFTATKTSIHEIADDLTNGEHLKFSKTIELVKHASEDLREFLNSLGLVIELPESYKAADNILNVIPDFIQTLGYFNEKKYGAGIMNSILLLNNYILRTPINEYPFKNSKLFDYDKIDAENIVEILTQEISILKPYATNIDEKISSLIGQLEKIRSECDTIEFSQVEKKIKDLYVKIRQYKYKFNAGDIYRKLIKYTGFMTAIFEAQSKEDIITAIDAAILPTGSSAIKYYTASSFSINSYIGVSYFKSIYNSKDANNKNVYVNTFGASLPIGVNFSLSTRNKYVGAVSLFASVVDLGAVASYRLSTSENVSSQALPDFTFQNILSPGGFLIFNRLFKSPLALGIGRQIAPQLTNIKNGVADISDKKTWRTGVFLAVDIPFFNFYSKSLKRPID